MDCKKPKLRKLGSATSQKTGSKPLLLRLRNTISSHGFSYDKNEEKYLVKVADFVQNTHGDDVIKTHFVATTDKKKKFLLEIVAYCALSHQKSNYEYSMVGGSES